jgi:tetratricopeptide (TPR) repeat protein
MISKGGALIFGVGLGALLATLALMVGLALPFLSARLENLPYYARNYYRKLFPPPQYLPTPAPTLSIALTLTPTGTPVASLASPETPPPTATPTPELIVSPSPEATAPPQGEAHPPPNSGDTIELRTAGSQVQLTGLTHQWQTWNNCGPATITMFMSYFGRPETQVEAAQYLKPNRDDKNVSPQELAAYAQTVGLGAIIRHGGTIEQLKTFLSNGFPVLAETWLVHDGDGLGHYRLVTGYDDQSGQFSTFDSLNGPNYKASYAQFDADWRVFNRLYIVVYPPEQAALVSKIIGEDMNEQVIYERLVALAQAEIEANPQDAIAYFNQGEALARLGRYREAIIAFDQARRLGLHWRRLWYQFVPFEAYYAEKRYQDVLDLAEATISSSGGLEEVYYYQGKALQATGQPGAAEAFEAAIAYNPNFALARQALEALPNQP